MGHNSEKLLGFGALFFAIPWVKRSVYTYTGRRRPESEPAAWSAPDGSRPLRSLAKWAIPCLPLHPPPPLPQDFRIGEMHTQKSGWLALFQDTDSTVTLLHVTTGTVREAPWLALRTPHGEVYFANLVTRETRWLGALRRTPGHSGAPRTASGALRRTQERGGRSTPEPLRPPVRRKTQDRARSGAGPASGVL